MIEHDGAGWRLVEVEVGSGQERLGAAAPDELLAWTQRWWPQGESGDRVEVGLARDRFWAEACARVTRGTSLAIDYGHLRDYRPRLSTLRSYRQRARDPVAARWRP